MYTYTEVAISLDIQNKEFRTQNQATYHSEPSTQNVKRSGAGYARHKETQIQTYRHTDTPAHRCTGTQYTETRLRNAKTQLHSDTYADAPRQRHKRAHVFT